MSQETITCLVCGLDEGNDPKAHICICGECGDEFEEYAAACDCNEKV
jgi:hypothetical protein